MTNATIKHGELNLRKVERTAKAGDYVVFKGIEEGYGVTTGKPYAVHGDARYIDNDGSNMDVYGWNHSDPNPDIYEVFEEPSNKLAGLRKVTGRKAKAGDYVVYKRSHNGTPQGEPFEVLNGDYLYQSHTHEFSIDGWGGSQQYDLYEVAPAAKSGDRVKILALSKYGLNYIGKTGVVAELNFFNEGWTVVDPEEEGPSGLYLPEHLELIEEETTLAYTFKEGDKVRVLDGRKGRYNDLSTGAEGVIDDIDFEYEEAYRVSTYDDYDRFKAEDIELIVTPAVEFEMGDRVEVLDASKGNFQDQRDGAIGVISDISHSGIRVAIDGDFDRFPAAALRKIPMATAAKAPKEEQPTFKVGDKVRMISTNPYHGMGEIETGDIGTLRSVSGSMFTANFPKQSYWNGLESEFELVEDEKGELAFEEGDLIRITNKDAIDGAYDTTNGETYEIVEVDEDGDITIMDDEDEDLCILRREFDGIEKVDAEEATEGEFEQFQRGDKVVLVSGGGMFPLSGFKNGSEYEVRNTDFGHSEGRLIQINKGASYDNGYAHPSQLKKVEATPAPKTPKFSIGDKAILTSMGGNPSSATMGFEIGDEVTIAGVSCGDNDHKIRNSFTTGFASDHHLTAVGSPELKVAKAGDFVEIDFDFVGGNFSYVDITQGKAYEVVTSEYTKNLVFKDDEGDNRGAHIEQGAYTVVDAPAVAKVAAKEYQFVAGDFVRFTDAEAIDCSDGLLTNGKVYEVVRADEPGFHVKDDEGDSLYIGGYESEYYEKVDAPAPRKLQVGDIVRVDRSEGEAWGSINKPGDIGEVTDVQYTTSVRVQVPGRDTTSNYDLTKYLTLLVANENREDKK